MKWKDVRTPYIHAAPEWETHSNADHITTRHRKQLASGYDPKISDEGQTVGVVDERSEIGACYQGIAQMISGFRQMMSWMHVKKDRAWICWSDPYPRCDRRGRDRSKEDVEALFFCAYRDAAFLQRPMERNKESLSKNPYMREIINKRCFSATWS